MKFYSMLIFSFIFLNVSGQVVLDANGEGNTYELITSVLAPEGNPIEVPDCAHPEFGNHIDEVFDDELNAYVFRFHIHTTPDNDRCIKFDRQRNEIKTYDKSPENLLGVENETVIYKWKFKLEYGFQSSSSFTHIHQIKSVGGSLASMPMYTLTTRKSSPDQLELRYAETDSQVTLTKTDLEPFIGSWVDFTETIKYGTSGTYEIEIKKVSDNSVLFSYSNSSIVNWRSEADFVRPKWGIYRSLNSVEDLRDEMVYFANFSIEEIDELSSYSVESNSGTQVFFLGTDFNTIRVKNQIHNIDLIKVYGFDGRRLLEKTVDSKKEIDIDISTLSSGNYIINIKGENINQSKLIHVYK